MKGLQLVATDVHGFKHEMRFLSEPVMMQDIINSVQSLALDAGIRIALPPQPIHDALPDDTE